MFYWLFWLDSVILNKIKLDLSTYLSPGLSVRTAKTNLSQSKSSKNNCKIEGYVDRIKCNRVANGYYGFVHSIEYSKWQQCCKEYPK